MIGGRSLSIYLQYKVLMDPGRYVWPVKDVWLMRILHLAKDAEDDEDGMWNALRVTYVTRCYVHDVQPVSYVIPFEIRNQTLEKLV